MSLLTPRISLAQSWLLAFVERTRGGEHTHTLSLFSQIVLKENKLMWLYLMHTGFPLTKRGR